MSYFASCANFGYAVFSARSRAASAHFGGDIDDEEETAGNDNKSDDSDAEDKPLDAFLLGKALAETVLERTATEVVNFISDATNLPTKIEDEMEQLKREVEKRAKEDAGRGV